MCRRRLINVRSRMSSCSILDPNRWTCCSPPTVLRANAAKKRSSGKSKGSKSKRGHGGVREEIRQLQEVLGVDDPNRTPQVETKKYSRSPFDGCYDGCYEPRDRGGGLL